MPYSNSGVTHYTVNGTGRVSKWTVCKYADGVIEIYARTSSADSAMTSTYGNGFYTSVAQAIPSGIFTSIDYASVHRCGGSTSNGLISVSLKAMTTSEISWYVYNTQTGTLNIVFAIHIVGRWDRN